MYTKGIMETSGGEHHLLKDAVKAVGTALVHSLYFFPAEAPDHMSEHYTVPVAVRENRWDSEGTYFDGSA